MKCISVPRIQMEAGVSALSLSSVLNMLKGSLGGGESYLFVVMQVKRFSFPFLCLGLSAETFLTGRMADVCSRTAPLWSSALSSDWWPHWEGAGGGAPVTTHPPLHATRVTFMQRRSRLLISSTIVRFVLKCHAVSECRQFHHDLFVLILQLWLPNEGSFKEDPCASSAPNQTLQVADADAASFVLLHLGHRIPSVSPQCVVPPVIRAASKRGGSHFHHEQTPGNWCKGTQT